MESFLYCLCSRLKMIFTYTVQQFWLTHAGKRARVLLLKQYLKDNRLFQVDKLLQLIRQTFDWFDCTVLELRQYKNDAALMQNQLHLNLPHFFAHHIEELNSAANSKLIFFRQSGVVLILSQFQSFQPNLKKNGCSRNCCFKNGTFFLSHLIRQLLVLRDPKFYLNVSHDQNPWVLSSFIFGALHMVTLRNTVIFYKSMKSKMSLKKYRI